MKWIDYILNCFVYFFYPQESKKEQDYDHLNQEKEFSITLPDTPLFHVLNSILESIQVYMIEPFIHSLEQLSLENSTIEILFYWKPFFKKVLKFEIPTISTEHFILSA